MHMHLWYLLFSFWEQQFRHLLWPTEQTPSSAFEYPQSPACSPTLWTDYPYSPYLPVHQYSWIPSRLRAQSCQPKRAIVSVVIPENPRQDPSIQWKQLLLFRLRYRLAEKRLLKLKYWETRLVWGKLYSWSWVQSARRQSNSCVALFSDCKMQFVSVYSRMC